MVLIGISEITAKRKSAYAMPESLLIGVYWRHGSLPTSSTASLAPLEDQQRKRNAVDRSRICLGGNAMIQEES